MKLSDIDLHSKEEIDDAIDLLRVRKRKLTHGKHSSGDTDDTPNETLLAGLKAIISPLEESIKGLLERLDGTIQTPVVVNKKGLVFKPKRREEEKKKEIPPGWLRVCNPRGNLGEVYLQKAWYVECGFNRNKQRVTKRKCLAYLEDPENPGTLFHHNDWFIEKERTTLNSFRVYKEEKGNAMKMSECLRQRESLYPPLMPDL